MTRITGINSGLDIDALVKASLTSYQNKVDKETQNKKVLEYQQEQYKQIMSDASSFYDKYFDILKTGNLMSSSTYSTVAFTASDPSKVTAQGFAGSSVDNYKVSVTQLAAAASDKLSLASASGTQIIKIGSAEVGFELDFELGSNGKETVANYNKAVSAMKTKLAESTEPEDQTKLAYLNANTITATYSEFSNSVTFTASKMGGDGFQLNGHDPAVDKYLNAIIENSKGEKYKIEDSDKKISNTVTVDNVQFTLKAITGDNPVALTGATDVTNLKDKIINFVNDYNTLLLSINTKIYETRDTDYMPLTDAQKEAMTDSQITAWEKKAQMGLLRKDSDLQRIANAMKSAMSTVMSGTGSYLEKIGISPVKDYAEKNGMLTIDENKLTTALQDNAQNVKDLFTRAASTTNTTDKGGIITQLGSLLKGEFKTSTSSLSKKAGLAGTATELSNILTKSITAKTTLIATLNSSLTDKESALYKKYSALETAIEKLNAQQSSLTSMFG